MTPEVGYVGVLRDGSASPQLYLILILAPSLRHPERWRCLVLVDDVNVDDAGLIVEYNSTSLENFFDCLT
jgi:hypothetical protein